MDIDLGERQNHYYTVLACQVGNAARHDLTNHTQTLPKQLARTQQMMEDAASRLAQLDDKLEQLEEFVSFFLLVCL